MRGSGGGSGGGIAASSSDAAAAAAAAAAPSALSLVLQRVSNPIDVVKVRMQLQGELTAHSALSRQRHYRGVFSGVYVLYREEGIAGLYRGFSAAIIRELVFSSIRIGGYEPTKKLLGERDGEHMPFWRKFLAGAVPGAVGAVVANPTDVVKIRMQAVGEQRYRGFTHALVRIVAEEGVHGLYKGVGPTTLRACLLTAAQLSTYDHSKQFLIRMGMAREGIGPQVASGLLSGLATTLISCPVDVVKARYMNQGVHGEGIAAHRVVYRSAFDCFVQTLRTEGIPGLFKGFSASYARLGPSIAVQLLVYEQLRRLFGLRPV